MNRRDFLTIGNPLNGGASLPRNRGEETTHGPQIFMRRSATGLEPWAPGGDDGWDYAKAAHLLRRCMIGPTETEIRAAVDAGLEGTLASLLTPFTPPLTLIADWAGQDPQIRAAGADETSVNQFLAELLRKGVALHSWWLDVMARSPVSIQERMTLFWHGHFTSELQVVKAAEFMYGQNQLLRRSALGNFKQMVKDVTKDMAMLVYLDGVQNSKRGTKSNINENYARELMELFTMGPVDWDANPNYTQSDVSEAARALSGYTATTSSKGSGYVGLASQFTALLWDSGQKTVLGRTGAWKADDVVDIIFSERSDQVAKFICAKIYRAFVYDIPDPVVVTAMAETFRSSNWELAPVIRELLRSAHFFDLTNIGALDKSPVDYVIGLVRGLGLGNVPDLLTSGVSRLSQDLRNRLTTYGMTLFDPPNVKGWPGGRSWISTSTLPLRQKFGLDIMDKAIKVPRSSDIYYRFDPIAFAKRFSAPGDIHALSQEMSRFILNVPPSEMEAQQLYAALLDGGVDYEWSIDDPEQKPDERIRKFLKVAFQLAKYQLY